MFIYLRYTLNFGPVENFIQAMDVNIARFVYLTNTFPRIRDAKMQEGAFAGPHTKELKQYVKFEYQLTELEKAELK
jgi:hypothetical protein